jgi:chromate transporter
MTETTSHDQRQTTRGSAAEVFAAFLKLGLTSFGGPIAHLGYFRVCFGRRVDIFRRA